MSGRTQILLQLFTISLLFALPCAAQETPEWEFFGGYSLQRSDVREYYKSSPTIYSIRSHSANLNGWNVSVTENLSRRFGGSLDVSGHYGTAERSGVTNRQRAYSILYGPRIAHRKSWGTAFVHVQIGATRAEARVTPVGPRVSEFSFALAAGGGLDMNLGKKAAIRVIKAEYFRANILGASQNGLRLSAGLIYRLGSK